MRVRNLQSYLQEQGLVNTEKALTRLKGARVGVDVVTWLRSIQFLKDPFADALGGIPPSILVVDKELEHFKKNSIVPIFVFQGVTPGPQQSNFVGRMEKQAAEAWIHMVRGQKDEAQKCFAVSTSRINGDLVQFIMQHLRNKGHECVQAPYLAGAQLAHFAEQGIVQTVFGSPGLLLYGLQRVIIHLDFGSKTRFDWVDLNTVLTKWEINHDQFVDACLLAGTDYCLTYPYLNLSHFGGPTNPGRFNFGEAVSMIKRSHLINWMQAFPTEEMREDHVDGYCICKVLVQSSPVLDISTTSIKQFGSSAKSGAAITVPHNFKNIMGDKLPESLYCLMMQGFVSNKLPQALAKGEWTDKTQPAVDTQEFRSLLDALADYRSMALGTIARHLPPCFKNKTIVCRAFWETQNNRQQGEPPQPEGPPRTIQPIISNGLRWNITAEAVAAEMTRQSTDKVDFKFCLQWHAKEADENGQLIKDLSAAGGPLYTKDQNSLAALVHFMTLERLGLIDADDGGMTYLGSVLKDSPSDFQEPCLVALELTKFGYLCGDPFDEPEHRPFPAEVLYPKAASNEVKSKLLICRVVSLVPMKLRTDMWNAEVDFDLAAFHSLVRILKRSLRQLVEASLTSALLTDLGNTELLPNGFMCASPAKDNHYSTPAILPTFMSPRACMGIVFKYFLNYTGEPQEFTNDLKRKFPCCVQAKEDLKTAFLFWADLRRCIDEIAEAVGAEEFAENMRVADTMMQAQRVRLNLVDAA